MQLSAFYADWDTLRRELESAGDGFSLGEAVDDDGGWIEDAPPTLECDSFAANEITAGIFDALKGHLDPAPAQHFETFLQALLMLDGGHGYKPPKDLPLPAETPIVAAFSPASVTRYLQMFENLSLEQLTKPFDESAAGAEPFESADEFIGYIRMWGEICFLTSRGMGRAHAARSTGSGTS